MQAAISTAHLAPMTHPKASSSGARLVAADGRELSFLGATVHVRAQGGLAVAVLTQRFANPYSEPLSVRYTMPLPAEAAVRGYSFLIGAKLVRGEVDRKRSARERFDRAVAEGRTAGLLDQERSSVFNQELGNIPPGEELVAMIELDQRLIWLDDGQWEWRFPTVVAPRYLGAEGRVADADRVTVALADRPQAPRVELVLHVLDAVEGEATSPTHGLATSRGEGVEIRLGQASRLDRDIAVRWPVAQPAVGVALQVARPEAPRPTAASAFGLLTVVPPSPRSRPRALPRDLIFLLDASGSMFGAPIEQAKQVMRALIQSLEDQDRIELISFGDRPHRWKRGASQANAATRREALAWVDRLQAEGGTEMRSGILEALAPLRDDAQRQVVLITDGLIGFESEIVATLHDRLPRGCRLHTVGVGSGINRSLTGPAARAGRGVEVLIDIDGDAAEATRRLLARTCAPLVTELTVSGSAVLEHAPAKLPDLFAGAPALLSLRLDPRGGKVKIEGTTALGPWSAEIDAPAQQPGEGSPSLAALFGRERVEDLEALHARGRDQGSIDRQIEQTGLDHQISTRLTSWVAITEHRTVDPEAAKKLLEVASELPHGMNAASLGLRPAAATTLLGGLAAPAGPATGAMPPPPAPQSSSLFSLKALADSEEEESDGFLEQERGIEKKKEARESFPRRSKRKEEAPGNRPSIAVKTRLAPVIRERSDSDDAHEDMPAPPLAVRAIEAAPVAEAPQAPAPSKPLAPPSMMPGETPMKKQDEPASSLSFDLPPPSPPSDRAAPEMRVGSVHGALPSSSAQDPGEAPGTRTTRGLRLALWLAALLALIALLVWFFTRG